MTYWFSRTKPPTVPIVKTLEEARNAADRIAISANSHPEFIWKCLATRLDIDECYIIPRKAFDSTPSTSST